MADNQTTEIPLVGSLWMARDGRIMQVENWFPPGEFGTHAARMKVLNAKKGMRRTTQADLRGFGSFLKPYEGGAASD